MNELSTATPEAMEVEMAIEEVESPSVPTPTLDSLPEDILCCILSWIEPSPDVRWVWHHGMSRICSSIRAVANRYFLPTILNLDILWPGMAGEDRIPYKHRLAFLRSFLTLQSRSQAVHELRLKKWPRWRDADEIVRAMLTSPNLLVNLKRVSIIKEDAVFVVPPDFLIDMSRAHPGLSHLCIHDSFRSCLAMSRDQVLRFSRTMSSLRVLRLKDAYFLDDIHMAILSSACTNLEELELSNHRTPMSSITDQGLQILAKHCTKLTVLKLCLVQITWAGLESLLAANPGLVSLNISCCCNIGALACDSIARLALNLQVLHCHGCHWLDDHGLDRLVSSSSSLRTIGLDNTHVTPEGVYHMLQKRPQYLGKAPKNSLLAAIDIGYFHSTLEKRLRSMHVHSFDEVQSVKDIWLLLATEFDVNFAVTRNHDFGGTCSCRSAAKCRQFFNTGMMRVLN